MNEAVITINDAENGIKVASISGQLDESNVDEKIKDIYKVVEQIPKGLKLIFDLENLEYMNSKSIGYLTDLYGKISETGGKVVIAKARPNIIDILQVVGLTQLINSYGTLEEAKMAMNSPEGAAPEAAPETEAAPAEPTPAEAQAEAPAPEATPAETPAEPAAEAAPEVAVEPVVEEAPAAAEAPAVEPTPDAVADPAPADPAPAETPAEAVPAEPTPAETPAAPATPAPTPDVEVAPVTEPAPTEAPAEPAPTPETPEPASEAPANPNEDGGTYKFEQ